MPGSFSGSKIKAKKRFGQNFLVNEDVIEEIIAAAEITSEDTVLEIGPGKGALTRKLANKAKNVVAVEIDWDLAALLSEELSDLDNITIVRDDILKLNLKEILGEYESLKIVANLPYYITTPIMMMLLESGLSFDRMVLMVQKEVALRMCAAEDTPDYGALSLAVGFYTSPEIVTEVPAACFRPVPKVDSCVVKLDSKTPICNEEEREYLFKIIRAAFFQRRKTLVNALSSAQITSKDEIRSALKEMGIKENIRGEALSLSDYHRLLKIIRESN